MGVVYEVEHELTKHHRALKVLHARAAATPGVLDRFFREATAAARIGNSHVAETFDAGRLDSGEPYLLMELVEGHTLDERVQREGPIPPGELADLICQACEGVQAAHDAGIIHRDLKPENLMVSTREGVPFIKILDFGISKFDEGATGAHGITTEGAVMGTPYYMSPEQVRGAAFIDRRTDVYALGVILYECACGAVPFDAKSIETLSVLIYEGKAPPLGQRNPSLPADFCAVVHRAMARDRELRFASARALGEALAPMRVRTIQSFPPGTAPRAVVRSSAPSPYDSDTVALAAGFPSTDAALAATMGESAARKRWGAVRVLGVGAAAAFAIGAGAAVVAVRGFHAPSSEASHDVGPSVVSASAPRVATELAVTAVKDSSAPVVAVEVSAAPPSRAVTGPSWTAARPAAGPVANGPAAATSGSAARAAASSGPSASPPAPARSPDRAAPGRTRVDQTGLAGENPFQ
jgi:serine/threonine-protein kinase